MVKISGILFYGGKNQEWLPHYAFNLGDKILERKKAKIKHQSLVVAFVGHRCKKATRVNFFGVFNAASFCHSVVAARSRKCIGCGRRKMHLQESRKESSDV